MALTLRSITKKLTLNNAFKALDSAANVVGQYVINKSPYGALYQYGESIADARTYAGTTVAGKIYPATKVPLQPRNPAAGSGTTLAVIDSKSDIKAAQLSQTVDNRDFLTKLIDSIEAYFK